MKSGRLREVENRDVRREQGVGLVLEGLHDPGALDHGNGLSGGQTVLAGTAYRDGAVELLAEDIELVLDLQQGVSAITRDFRRSARGPWPCDRCV